MEKHFCTCTDKQCPCHPANHGSGCDPCIKKNLGRGEIPACFYHKVGGTAGLTDYTMESFVRFFIKHRGAPPP